MVHLSIEKFLSGACLLLLPYEHRFKQCEPLIKRFLDPGILAWTRFFFTKDRVCNETIGVCKSPIIRKIPVEEAVSTILARKPENIKNDDFV